MTASRVVGGEKPLARDLALHDDVVGPAARRSTIRRWFGDGSWSTVCRTTISGARDPLDELEDVLAVAAAEEPELVLDDDGVETVERVHRLGERRARAAHPLGDDLGRRCRLAGRVDAAHHADARSSARAHGRAMR